MAQVSAGVRIKPAKRDKLRFNFMAVGESGQGKTTFLQALLRRYVDNCKVESPELPINEKTIAIAKVGDFEVNTDNGDALDIVLYDSPGYGDFINNQEAIEKIKKYIFQCHQQWRSLDAQSMTEAEFLMADERIHCVFYFLSSHRMKDIDREFITQLSPIVPIIPIIGKADTMTLKERNTYIQQVKTKLDEISERFGEKCIYDFEGDDLDENNDVTNISATNSNRIPNIFACVCDASRERVYPWGTLNIENGRHSDFRRLQTIIFENDKHLKGMMDLARLKTIKLFRKAHPAVHSAAPTPLSATVANHSTTAAAPSPISIQKRSQSQSKISERTSDVSINLEDRLTESMNISTEKDNKSRQYPPASNTSMPPKPGSAPGPADLKAQGSSTGLFRKFVGGKAK